MPVQTRRKPVQQTSNASLKSAPAAKKAAAGKAKAAVAAKNKRPATPAAAQKAKRPASHQDRRDSDIEYDIQDIHAQPAKKQKITQARAAPAASRAAAPAARKGRSLTDDQDESVKEFFETVEKNAPAANGKKQAPIAARSAASLQNAKSTSRIAAPKAKIGAKGGKAEDFDGAVKEFFENVANEPKVMKSFAISNGAARKAVLGH